MVALAFDLLFIGGAVVAPAVWFRRSRRSGVVWKKRWWAVALGLFLLFGVSGSHQTFPRLQSDPWGWIGATTGFLLTAFCGTWLIAWGARGRRIMPPEIRPFITAPSLGSLKLRWFGHWSQRLAFAFAVPISAALIAIAFSGDDARALAAFAIFPLLIPPVIGWIIGPRGPKASG